MLFQIVVGANGDYYVVAVTAVIIMELFDFCSDDNLGVEDE